jgi:hypothetical protein
MSAAGNDAAIFPAFRTQKDRRRRRAAMPWRCAANGTTLAKRLTEIRLTGSIALHNQRFSAGSRLPG